MSLLRLTSFAFIHELNLTINSGVLGAMFSRVQMAVRSKLHRAEAGTTIDTYHCAFACCLSAAVAFFICGTFVAMTDRPYSYSVPLPPKEVATKSFASGFDDPEVMESMNATAEKFQEMTELLDDTRHRNLELQGHVESFAVSVHRPEFRPF